MFETLRSNIIQYFMLINKNLRDKIKEDEMGMICSTLEGVEESIKDFGGKARKKETTSQT
jgi:hypothetical protein